jgi:PHD/YefM family antitoxin component YafN of YafNO toxin-antitoxin module
MLAEEDYDGLLETLELLSVAGLRASLAEAEDEIAAGQTVAFEDVLGGR